MDEKQLVEMHSAVFHLLKSVEAISANEDKNEEYRRKVDVLGSKFWIIITLQISFNLPLAIWAIKELLK